MDEHLENTQRIYEESIVIAKKFYKEIDKLYFEFMTYYNDNYTKIVSLGYEKKLIPIAVVCADQTMDLGTMLNVTKEKAKNVKMLAETNMPDSLFCIMNDINDINEEIYHSFAYPRFSSIHALVRSICEVYSKFQLLYSRIGNQKDFNELENYYRMKDYSQSIAILKSYINDQTARGYPNDLISNIRRTINTIQFEFTNTEIDNSLDDGAFVSEAERINGVIRNQDWCKNVKKAIGEDNDQIGKALENNNAWKLEDPSGYSGAYTIYRSISSSTHNNISAIQAKAMFNGAIQFNSPIYHKDYQFHNFQALLSCGYFCMKDVVDKFKLILK